MKNIIDENINKQLYDINIEKEIKKAVLLILGLFLISYAIALSIRCNLGTTAISTIPYELSFIVPISVGSLTIIFQTSLLIMQRLLLKSSFPKVQYLQFVVALIFGNFINFSLTLTVADIPHTPLQKWILCIISCFIMALGLLVEINSKSIILPADGLIIALSHIKDKEFGKIKTKFDVICVLIAASLSIICFGSLKSVGLGTIFAAVVVGYIMRFYRKIIKTSLNYINKHDHEIHIQHHKHHIKIGGNNE